MDMNTLPNPAREKKKHCLPIPYPERLRRATKKIASRISETDA
jgi:hypothetical protein